MLQRRTTLKLLILSSLALFSRAPAMEISPQVDKIVKILNTSRFNVAVVYYDFSAKRQEFLGEVKLVKGDNLTEILATIEEKDGFKGWVGLSIGDINFKGNPTWIKLK